MTEAAYEDIEAERADAALIAAVRGGDTEAYATLYERHAVAARGLARQLASGQAEVDDIVADTFERVLTVIQRGGGPSDGFRPYLLTALRNVAYDRFRGNRRQLVTDDVETFDRGEPFVDPALEGLERSLIAQAFLTLPQRWQAVLWHTEIEGGKPGEVAQTLGMTANGVAALAYRAREGLRQAYLQMHLAGGAPAETCRPTLNQLGAYVRGALSRRDSTNVDAHLDSCVDCRGVYAELMDVNVGLRVIIGPLILGPVSAGYLASLPTAAGAGGLWARMPRRQQQAAAGGTAAAAVAAAAALAVVSHEEASEPEQPPAAASEEHEEETETTGGSEPDTDEDEPEADEPSDASDDDGPASEDDSPGEAADAEPAPPAEEPVVEDSSPDAAEESEEPESPEAPEEPEEPEGPEEPEPPEAPEEPEAPEPPESPEEPEAPEQPDPPEAPEWPEPPDWPDLPDWPQPPELPEQPEWPEQPDAPEPPGQQLPELPDLPELPEIPPDPPEMPEAPEAPSEIPGAPTP